ncbi:MAG: glycosyltransferase family 2 protein [Gemmiger sp.]|nr:glycosyltransferase family 2 protein [Gemmiger sp.]
MQEQDKTQSAPHAASQRGDMPGVPAYRCEEFAPRHAEYCLLIPVINEGARILTELGRIQKAGIDKLCDVILCDGGSVDGSMAPATLQLYDVNTLLTKTGPGKQGAQLRMGLHFALERGYRGVLTVDGNNKDSVEDVPKFIAKLRQGYDLVQGSRFVPGGHAVNTPPSRYLAVRLLHAPLTSLAAGCWFTDTTNAYRAYSREYLTHPAVKPLRDVFMGYELLAYLSVRATQLGLKACEVPVTRAYPATGKTPTKISGLRGNSDLLRILLATLAGKYNP